MLLCPGGGAGKGLAGAWRKQLLPGQLQESRSQLEPDLQRVQAQLARAQEEQQQASQQIARLQQERQQLLERDRRSTEQCRELQEHVRQLQQQVKAVQESSGANKGEASPVGGAAAGARRVMLLDCGALEQLPAALVRCPSSELARPCSGPSPHEASSPRSVMQVQKLISNNSDLHARVQELERMVRDSEAARRKLHNQVQVSSKLLASCPPRQSRPPEEKPTATKTKLSLAP